jgi:hypothetical protein
MSAGLEHATLSSGDFANVHFAYTGVRRAVTDMLRCTTGRLRPDLPG